MLRPRRRPFLAVVAAGAAVVAYGAAGGAQESHAASRTELLGDALKAAPAAEQPFHPLTYRPVPEDRYAMAGGCYVLRSEQNGRYLTRSESTFVADAKAPGEAEPLHFQALDLGKYLLFGAHKDFLAADGDPAPDGHPPGHRPDRRRHPRHRRRERASRPRPGPRRGRRDRRRR